VSFERARLVLELDAIAHFGIGVLLILASWNGAYRVLDLPRVNPALFAQVGGAAFIGFAWLLWITPSVPELAREVAAGAAVANAIAGLIVLGWLIGRWSNLSDYWHVGVLGKTILVGISLTLLGLASIERQAFKRGIAPPPEIPAA